MSVKIYPNKLRTSGGFSYSDTIRPTPVGPLYFYWEYEVGRWILGNYATSVSSVPDPDDPQYLSSMTWRATPRSSLIQGTAGSQGHVIPSSLYYGGGRVPFDIITGPWRVGATIRIEGGASSGEQYVTEVQVGESGYLSRPGTRTLPYIDTMFTPGAASPHFSVTLTDITTEPAATIFPLGGKLYEAPLVYANPDGVKDPNGLVYGGPGTRFRAYSKQVNIGPVDRLPLPARSGWAARTGERFSVDINSRRRGGGWPTGGQSAIVVPNNSRRVAVTIFVDAKSNRNANLGPRNSPWSVYRVSGYPSSPKYAGGADYVSPAVIDGVAGTNFYFDFEASSDEAAVITTAVFGREPSHRLEGQGDDLFYNITTREQVVTRSFFYGTLARANVRLSDSLYTFVTSRFQ